MADLKLPEMIAALDEQEGELLLARGKVEAQLNQVRTARAALLALQNDDPLNFEGKLAMAIRTVLRNNAGRSLTPLDVRDAIKAIGYDLRRHSNVMASIHSVLKRLADAENGEVKAKVWKNTPGTRYYWAGSPPVGVGKEFAILPPATLRQLAEFGTKLQRINVLSEQDDDPAKKEDKK